MKKKPSEGKKKREGTSHDHLEKGNCYRSLERKHEREEGRERGLFAPGRGGGDLPRDLSYQRKKKKRGFLRKKGTFPVQVSAFRQKKKKFGREETVMRSRARWNIEGGGRDLVARRPLCDERKKFPIWENRGGRRGGRTVGPRRNRNLLIKWTSL